MSGRLQAWLRGEGEAILAETTLQAALERQRIYGGGLDTALLERRAMTEPAVWARLAAVTGLPVPGPEMCDASGVLAAPALAAELTAPLRTVPVGREDDVLDLLCAEPVATEAIRDLAARHGFRARLYVVPEARLFGMRQRIYGEPLPARYAPLLAEALGATRARRAFSGTGPSRPREEASTSPSTAAVAGAAGRALPPPLPRPSEFAGDWPSPHPSSTPLEHFLDLSGPLPIGGSDPDADAEVEARMELALQMALDSLGQTESAAQRTRANGEGGSGPQSSTGEAAQAGPAATPPVAETVRLEVLSSTPADSEAVVSAPLEGSGDFATEALCRRARDLNDKGRLLALRALRQRTTHAATQALLQDLRFLAAADPEKEDPAQVVSAIEALAELRDGATIPLLIERLAPGAGSPDVVSAAHRALVALCAQDFGRSQRRWQTWARAHGAWPRVEWLLEGLAHKNAGIRDAAVEELRHIAGDSFGYEAKAPKRERDTARRRFVAWWEGLSRPTRTNLGEKPAGAAQSDGFLPSEQEAPLPPAPKAR